MRALVIGGTRNLGRAIVAELLTRSHAVTTLNRGVTADDLPRDVERLHADRTDERALAHAVSGRDFDAVIDMAVYDGADARGAVSVFAGSAGRYVFISSGQVYLVREPEPRSPAREQDYDGALAPRPPRGSPLLDGWLYGVGKREAEDVFAAAAARGAMSTVSLRLPMVNSARDHYHRLANYVARLRDGGPLLAPRDNRPLRHVFGDDVARIVAGIVERDSVPSHAYNLSQDETITIEEFVRTAKDVVGSTSELLRVPREQLEAERLMPECSPFSVRYMSVISNSRSKRELGATYTPANEYLRALIQALAAAPDPPGYEQRGRELALARTLIP